MFSAIFLFAEIAPTQFRAAEPIEPLVQPAPEPPPVEEQEETNRRESTKPQKKIVIDIATQVLTAYEDDVQIFQFDCSTGRAGWSTPKGVWPIREKRRYNRALPQFGSSPIPFSLRLDVVHNGRRRLIAIHAYHSVPRRPASHGCVRLSHKNAETLFNWAELGVPVKVR
jgi:lipoprotein-anchoring transpeptidase ErfK/SrfK